jgi:hypothetical protein
VVSRLRDRWARLNIWSPGLRQKGRVAAEIMFGIAWLSQLDTCAIPHISVIDSSSSISLIPKTDSGDSHQYTQDRRAKLRYPTRGNFRENAVNSRFILRESRKTPALWLYHQFSGPQRIRFPEDFGTVELREASMRLVACEKEIDIYLRLLLFDFADE